MKFGVCALKQCGSNAFELAYGFINVVDAPEIGRLENRDRRQE
jgi:hypothetical protein